MKNFLLLLLASIFGGVIGGFIVPQLSHPPKEKYVYDYYMTENEVMVSPHGLRKNIEAGKNTAIIVDLRSAEEYMEEHIKGAINIPAYKDRDTNAYDQVDRIVSEFQALPKDRDIIVYCYSIPCMTGRKVGKMLVEKGIFVKHLGIGWNEWKYDWKGWNHPHEWDITRPEDYIEGTKKTNSGSTNSGAMFNISPCSTDSTFGC